MMYNLYVLPLIAAVALSAALALVVWRRRISGARAFAILMLAVAEWSAAYVLELTSTSVPAKLFWAKVQYAGAVTVPVAWLVFALGYAGRAQWLTRRYIAPLVIVPLVTVLMTWTNDFHHLMISQVDLDTRGPFPTLDLTRGPWFWIHIAYSYLLLSLGTVAFVGRLLRSSHTYRWQVITLLIGALIPWAWNALYVLGASPLPNLDLTSFAFTLSSLVIVWGMFRFQLLDIVPIAYDAVIEGMRDGAIVVDAHDRVVDLNPAAERIIDHPVAKATGQLIAQLVPGWLDVIERYHDATEAQAEITLGEGEAVRIYDLRTSSLYDQQGRLIGRLVILRDITERKRAQKDLRRRDAILEAVSFAAEQFLRADSWEESIQGVLERLGQAAEVSRAYVFENQVAEDGTLLTSQQYEWAAPGIVAGAVQMEGSTLRNIPVRASGFGRWEEMLSQGELIHGPVREFPPEEYAFLSAQDIISIVVVPIFVGRVWWGFIGFDECVTEREWSVVEMDALKAAAGTLGTAIQRRQVEEALRESEERHRTLVENVPIGIYRNTPGPKGKFLMVNPAFLQIFDFDSEVELKEVSVADLYVNPEERETFSSHLLARGSITGVELQLRKKDGTPIWGSVTARVVHDETREVAYFDCTIEDVTARRRMEEERERLTAQIHEQAWQLEQIMNTVPEGVLLLDADRRIVLTNPVAEEDLSTLADAAGGDILTHLGDRSLGELLTSPPKGLWHEITLNGLYPRIFETIARPIETGPTPGGWVLVIRDVTREREIERRVRQQERLAAVGQLAAGVAHDFNNIMSTIVLYAQMMSRTEGLSSRGQEQLATIDDQAKQATDLIQQILDFSRRAVLEKQPIDLLPLLKEQVKLLERTLPENIQVNLTYGVGEHTVSADPTRIQQAVMNLAVNARDAMLAEGSAEGGRLHIDLERVAIAADESSPLPEMAPGKWVRVTVSDTGEGITADVLSHIFEPFFTTKERGRGTGLGLAQVHGIVKQHDGYIDVESHVDRGTTFTIYLPALPIPLSEPRALERDDLARGRGETVLLVEDDATARQALAACLEELNYRVLEARNGEEALEIMAEVSATDSSANVALVLSDVVMPRMGGIALLHALRERGWVVPLVLLTGHPLEEEIEGLREQGLSDWLSKPPSLAQLAEVISQALS